MPAVLLSVEQLKEHVETDLPDDAIQRLLDSEEGEIIARYGPHSAPVTETLHGPLGEFLFTTRQIATVDALTLDGVAYADYEVSFGGRAVRAKPYGAVWGSGYFAITYTPISDVAQRRRVLVDLCKLALQYSGLNAETIGDYQMTAAGSPLTGGYGGQRESLFRMLMPRMVVA